MKKIISLFLLITTSVALSQHQIKLGVVVDEKNQAMQIQQEIFFSNKTSDTIQTLILNDWNHAYSDKNSPLGKRFADEFVRNFHLAKEQERGYTKINSITNESNENLPFKRLENQIDIIEVYLNKKLIPGEGIKIKLDYFIKLPNSKFTEYGWDKNGNWNVKSCFLLPSRIENGAFVKNSNLNLDDISNSFCEIDMHLTLPNHIKATCDLDLEKVDLNTFFYKGKNRNDIHLFFEKINSFETYKINDIELIYNISNKLKSDEKTEIIHKIVPFLEEKIGKYPHRNIIISQFDYERNPFYGLNQLPSFLSPFTPQFLYELKFLKTYTNVFLKSSLQLDPRKDNWIFDAFQYYIIMDYIEKYYPDMRMVGKISRYKLFKGYNLVSMKFNEQFYYFYMLMVRKNLDQPLAFSKDQLLKFNEKIASKCNAGLSLKYLDAFLEKSIVSNSIKQFYTENINRQVQSNDFQEILYKNSNKNLDWFFNELLQSRLDVDFKFDKTEKKENEFLFSIKDKTDSNLPISVFGIKDKKVVSKIWIEKIKKDSIYILPRNGADKMVINYKKEVPELNQRNNWKSFKPLHIFNKPLKFNFLRDIENPHYNQIMYVPTIDYNYYDGLIPGIRLHNKTMLDKPFLFFVNPTFSTKTNTLSGSTNFTLNRFNRDSKLFLTRYSISYSQFHYAPDALYKKFNPSISFRFRQKDYRENNKQLLWIRYIQVYRQKSEFVNITSENYGVLNLKYSSIQSDLTRQFSYIADIQRASNFSKIEGEFEFRKLFNNNRSVNFRVYSGLFLTNKTNSDFFSFGLDRPTDYMFDYNLLGRSESTGLMSQQYVMAEGGFKSKFGTRYSNNFITTINAGFNIWNWVEIYGDAGIIKNKNEKAQFLYDSGIRLNLVTNYFELYFPVYSSNGFEINQPNYADKIRFVFTFSPQTLINLFTRKWF